MERFIDGITTKYGKTEFRRKDLKQYVSEEFGGRWPAGVKGKIGDYRVSRGVYDFASTPTVATPTVTPVPVQSKSVEKVNEISFIPSIDSTYVPFGNHKTLDTIVKSKIFYPTFITGLSGCLLYTSPSPRDRG